LFGLHLPAKTIRQIIHHAAEGVGVRATARLLGLDKDTVSRVILRAGQHCARVLLSLLTSLELKETQPDELWTICKKKKCSDSQEELECQYGQTWIWTAIDAPTRLLITFWIGRRELDDARRLIKDLTCRIQGKPLLVTSPHNNLLWFRVYQLINPQKGGFNDTLR